jgi:hypothetical protein
VTFSTWQRWSRGWASGSVVKTCTATARGSPRAGGSAPRARGRAHGWHRSCRSSRCAEARGRGAAPGWPRHTARAAAWGEVTRPPRAAARRADGLPTPGARTMRRCRRGRRRDP